MNKTHTPHHVVQDAVSPVSYGQGITINLRRDLHRQTATFGAKRSLPNLRSHLAADIRELRNLLRQSGYERSTINIQLKELIRQNKAMGGYGR